MKLVEAALDVERIVRLQRNVDRAVAALADEVEAVVEELAEQRHPAVERRRQALVGRDVTDEQRRFQDVAGRAFLERDTKAVKDRAQTIAGVVDHDLSGIGGWRRGVNGSLGVSDGLDGVGNIGVDRDCGGERSVDLCVEGTNEARQLIAEPLGDQCIDRVTQADRVVAEIDVGESVLKRRERADEILRVGDVGGGDARRGIERGQRGLQMAL